MISVKPTKEHLSKDLKTIIVFKSFSIFSNEGGHILIDKRSKRLIHIHRLQILSRNEIKKLIQWDPTLKNIHRLSVHELQELLLISKVKASNFLKKLVSKTLQKETLQVISKYDILTIFNDNYPSMLKTIKDPPLVLYTLGNKNILKKSPFLSVIGTRNPSRSGREKVERIVSPIIDEGWTIVSGMALGIDSYAHELTLKLSGKTIAVLGSGFHHIYPKRNLDLFHSIVTQGLVITEYPPHCKPARYHFPERNRIISGLSMGTLVIEATLKSGTLITVDQALDQGREVYVVPDSPFVRQAEGCNRLIQEGARTVLSGKDILEDFHYGASLFYKT